MRERHGHRFEWPLRSMVPNAGQSLSSTWLGRLLHSLSFIIVVIFLAAWITSFLPLKQTLSNLSLPGNVITDLACLSFFGGMIIAFLIAGIAGNLLQRFIS